MKTLYLLPLILVLAASLVSGLEVEVNRFDYAAYSSAASTYISTVHPSTGASDSAWGQSFRSKFDGANLTVLQVVMWQASATGGCTAYLIGETGTFGSSSLPTGSVLATSNEVTVAAAAAGTVYNFTFASGYILDAAVDYCFYVAGTSGDVTTEYIAVDNTAPIASDPSIGNAFYYDNSAWTAVGGSDVCFVMYGSDGSAVSFNLGGDVTINENTNVYNVTATGEVTATGAVTAGAVTAGDITASGGVTVDTVTASFNNTAVTAGDVNAAGAVTANGAITLGGDLSVNGTFDNATLTYATSSAVSGDANVYFLIAFIALAVLLTFYNKVPLMNFLVGIVGISFVTLSFQNTELPFWPYSSVLLALVSLLCMISGGFKMRNN